MFEATDPRGRKVVCTDQTWNMHILANRPWMEGSEDQVKRAIESPMPFGIAQDADYESRQIYYLLQKDRSYLKVVVEFDGEDGRVITAFETDSPKKGEKIIWPESSD